MRSIRRREVVLAAVLSMIAGFIDAVGFVHLGGYFVSFMSGNTTQMSADASLHVWSSAGKAAGLVGTFFAGVVLGAAVSRLGRSRMSVLWLVSVLLLLAAIVGNSGADIAGMLLLCAGMGAMNSVFQRDGEVAVGLTYMTGTLVKSGQRLIDAFTGGDRTLWLRHLLLWFALAVGGFGGALAYHHLGLHVLWLTAGVAGLVTVITGVVRRQLW
jgi:uncharacterized membrane protein YoaK (UPF0700 family)